MGRHLKSGSKMDDRAMFSNRPNPMSLHTRDEHLEFRFMKDIIPNQTNLSYKYMMIHNLDNHWNFYKHNFKNNNQLDSKLLLRELNHWPSPYKLQNRWKHFHLNVVIKVLTNINLFQHT